MEQVAEMLRGLQTKFDEQSRELKEMKESITSSINKNIDEKFILLESRQQQLEKITEEQSQKIQKFEKMLRKKNLIFFGIEESENSYFALQNNILDIINNIMKLDCQKQDIECVSRMGKKSEKIRPIIVTFTTMGKKIELLKNKKMLQKNSNFYIKEDFPPEVLEQRKKLSTQLKHEKEQGRNAYIKYNKLVIIPEKTNIHHERQKRNLSQSPESMTVVEREQKNISNNRMKKNKIDLYVVRNKSLNTETMTTSNQTLSKK